ncbi:MULTISPECIES: lytic transglycosylase domain-containing protein [unclassified Paracoccus (in: a-proteobacteria)]|uniref:lytic transglycosylase domain-containing protein n=1 Tax=unclassified Paracoccus (in: a-proteobacteria) TaxID=2688777 RepID=UPI0012B1F5C0|nr:MULTISPECIES: lytic transglycosylase domain-containing protein [unclassified Paracoccus (in: a-proteobacteria)]UXU76117.1 lytic transglycosylase domain-containing protein [Paracoccus sp. SMMA_5]UXU82029.1 lytic transglycosylase domain-containing protein [Paracoccus sp. SMMA_5_TC]
MFRLLLALVLAIMATPLVAYEALDAVAGRAAPRHHDQLRCTADGASCISLRSYVPDVCFAIERSAGRHNLDPHFLARLLWKESLFEPGAVSPVGAMGIAQFMPSTAAMVGLDDPFNPAKAIEASAAYLRRLIDGFGNAGLAAVAYNGGENRAARFIAQGGSLPWETQDYVQAITGLTAWNWRDNPPQQLDIRLDKQRPFRDACVQLAGSRKLREFKTPDHPWPWGVIVATHPSQSGVTEQVSRLNRQLRPILGGKRVSYVRRKVSGGPRTLYTAQIGYSNKTEAYAFCNRLRSLGGRCLVLKN